MCNQTDQLILSRFINSHNRACRSVLGIRAEAARITSKYPDEPEKQLLLPFNFIDRDLELLPEADKPLFCNNLALLFMHIDDLLCSKYHWFQGAIKYRYSYQILEYYLALSDLYDTVQSKQRIGEQAIEELKKCINGQIEYFGPATPEQDICLIREKLQSISNKQDFEDNVYYRDIFNVTFNYEKEQLVADTTVQNFYAVQKEYINSKNLFHAHLSMNQSGFMRSVLEKAAKDKDFGCEAYECFDRERYYSQRDQVAEVSGIDTTVFDYVP